jgi:hypothetical protein
LATVPAELTATVGVKYSRVVEALTTSGATRSFYNRGNAILVEACVAWAATDPAADELWLACPAADPPGCLLL